MSFVSDVVGSVLGGAKSAPQINLGSIQNPTSPEQVQQAQQQVANAYAQQLAFVQALQGNQGLSAQNQLLAQLQQQAQGQGPNPAAAQLAQATAANTANQAALMAGQRGASANAGLVGRQIAQQGAANQQAMAGQAATMQANQQLAAQQQLAALSGQQLGQQQAAIGQLGQIGLGQQGNLLGAQSNYNQAQMSGQQANLQAQTTANQQRNQMIGGLVGGAAVATGLIPTPKYNGGPINGKAPVPGDSPKNDIVPAMLSPGELVIPRSVLQSKDPEKAIIEFYKQHKNKPEIKQGYAEGGYLPEPIQDYEQNLMSKNNLQPDMSPVTLFGAPLAPQPDAEGNVKLFGNTIENVNPSPMSMPVADKPAYENVPLQAPMTKEVAQYVKRPDPTEPIQAAMQQQEAGIKKQAAAEGQLGQQEAALYRDQAAKQAEMSAIFNKQASDIQQRLTAANQHFQENPIDAQRFINSMPSGQKAVTAIGLILGGIGQGLAGGENMAVKMLNDNINRDIDAQIRNKDIQSQFIKNIQQEFGNTKDAAIMAKSMYADLVASKLQEAAAASKDPMAQARAQQAIGQLKAQFAPLQAEMNYRNSVFEGLQRGVVHPEQAIPALVPKEHQAKAFEEMKDHQVLQSKVQSVLQGFDKAAKLNEPMNRITNPLAAPREIEGISTQIKFLAKELAGRVSDQEIESLGHLIPKLGDNAQVIATKRQQLSEMMKNVSASPTLDAYMPNQVKLNMPKTVRPVQAPGSYNARSNK